VRSAAPAFVPEAWPHAAASRFVEAGGLRWHLQVMGEGPPALLLHGTGASAHSWRGVMPLLARRFTVVAPDLPGMGFTSMPPRAGLSLRGMADSLSAVIGALALAPALVVGHSAGAALGARMCLDGTVAPRLLVAVNGAMLPSLARELPRLETPLLQLVGKQDRTIRPTQARRLLALLPRAQVVAFPGLGHLAHEEAPDLVADAILEAMA
jgi:pimeloyl-ACP methyl ester carboxylesterase